MGGARWWRYCLFWNCCLSRAVGGLRPGGVDLATDPSPKILQVLQFLSSGCDLLLDVLEILEPLFEPLQLGGKRIAVGTGRLSCLGQAVI